MKTNEKAKTVKGYKAFDRGLVSQGKQYAENTVFEAKTCKDTMMFYKNPLTVLDCSSLMDDYCTLIDERGELREFAEVESLTEPTAAKGNSGVYFAKKLKIGAKIDVSALVQASISLGFEGTGEKKISQQGFEKIMSKAEFDEISSSRQSIHIGSSGDYVKIHSSGEYAHINSSGSFAKISSDGEESGISSNGYEAIIGSIGDFSYIYSSGGYARIISGGDRDCISVSGTYNQIVSVGKSAQITSCKGPAKIFSSGDSAQINCCGNFNMVTSKGKDAVICCTGIRNQVKAKKGSFITLAEWNEKDVRNTPACVKTVQVDGKIIKEDVFYTLENGEFVEFEDPIIDGKEPIKNPFSDSDMEIIFSNQKKKWLFKAVRTVRRKNKEYALSIEGKEGFGNKSNDYIIHFSLSDGDKHENNVTHKRFSDFEKFKAFVFNTFNLIEPATEAPDDELPY